MLLYHLELVKVYLGYACVCQVVEDFIKGKATANSAHQLLPVLLESSPEVSNAVHVSVWEAK